MKEIIDIVAAYEKAVKQQNKASLATVVLVEGSAYTRAGARMLITEDGQLTGAISGGCLEGDALRKARMVISRQEPLLVTYDTMDDDDAKLGVGLGCNGIINITQLGLVPEMKCFKDRANAWSGYIHNSLKKLIVTGIGQQKKKEE